MPFFLLDDTADFAKALITIPNVNKDLLISNASLKFSPTAPDNSVLSLPAKSTKFILLIISLIFFGLLDELS